MKHILILLSTIFICSSHNAQTELWGMTHYGGQYGAGTIFKTDGSGNNFTTIRHNFQIEGEYPSRSSLVQASNGKLYGMTLSGGIKNHGVLFEYDPSNDTYIKKIDFDSINGSNPYGSLMLASDGNLYGLTFYGGAANKGVLFQYNPLTNVFVKKLDFYTGTITARNPQGTLIQATNGKLYGIAFDSGFSELFEYDYTTGIFTNLHFFATPADGTYSYGSLMQASDGNLYGMTYDGGVNNLGVLFQFNLSSLTYTKKIDFDGAGKGSKPWGSLMQASDGNLYGMATEGGLNGLGVLFQFNPSTNSFVKKLDFDGTNNGASPYGSLMQATNGMLYGTTKYGGLTNDGVLFQFNPLTNTYTKKIDYGNGIYENGYNPIGTLMQATDGKLYGMTSQGGYTYKGVLFQFDPVTDIYNTKLYFLCAIDGKKASGSLLKASNGMLYGMTSEGGIYDKGVLFQIDPATNIYTKKLDFTGLPNGANPEGSLIEATDGKLYGLARNGGANNHGILFQYDFTTNTLVDKFDFDGSSSAYAGMHPMASLMQASDGKLYGTTSTGMNGPGIIFNFDLNTNVFTKKYTFIGGNNSVTSLIEAPDGNLYGTSVTGSPGGDLFQFNPLTSAYTSKFGFGYSGGIYGSFGNSLMKTNDGKIFGTTQNGGAFAGGGVLFNYNPIANVYTKKIDFDASTNGRWPSGTLIQASDGKLYGTTGAGGVNDKGVLFQYDTANTYVSILHEFLGPDGRGPKGVIEVAIVQQTSTNYTLASTSCAGSTNSVTYSVSGTYFAGNIFTLQLSDATGSFMSAVNIGSISSTASGIIYGTIPALTIQGNGYRVRIVSSNPVSVSNDNGSNITINSCADVWPGDANSDGMADNLDVLELGMHYTQTGPPRAVTSNSWQSYFANNWMGTISNGKNLNHSDCNGDGIINDDDTLAIFNNYGLTHAFKPAQTNTVNSQLSIVPDQAMVAKGNWGTASIYLGDATSTINDINGVAFTIDIDNTLIEPNSIYIEYQNSFMDAGQNLHFQKPDFASGKIYSATTHTVSNNVSGFGKIATLHYQILSSLSTDQVLNIGVSQANQSNASGVISPLTSGTGTLMAIGASVGVKETLMSGNVLISPNPTNGLLNVNFSTIPQNTKIEIYNSIGALVLTEAMTNKNNTINVSELSSGMYFMKVLEGNEVVAVKKVVKE